MGNEQTNCGSTYENSVMDEVEKRSKRNKMRARLERLMIKCKKQYRKFIHKLRDKVAKERRLLKKSNQRKVRAIKIKSIAAHHHQ